MKKLLLTALCVLSSGVSYALPVGNPADASLLCDGLIWEGSCCDPYDCCPSWCDMWSFRIGFYGDYNWNRHLEISSGPTKNADVEDTEIFTNAGYLALNICDRFDIFATLGATNFYIDSNVNRFASVPTPGQRIEIESETAFSWSIGGRATLWECGCTTLGIEGQYFRTCPNINRITIASVQSLYPDDFMTAKYSDWQVGIGIAHRINLLVPYLAVKWSGCKWAFSPEAPDPAIPLIIPDLENKKDWGYAVGVSLIDCEKASLTVEGRFADEKALFVGGQIRF